MAKRGRTIVALVAAVSLGACASGNSLFGEGGAPVTTSSLPETPKVDPACAGLSSQITSLRQEGVAERIEKAAAKKYKMTAVDLTKADQLTKASAEFQAKCSVTVRSVSAAPAVAAVSAVPPAAAGVSSAPPVKAAPKAATAVKKPASE